MSLGVSCVFVFTEVLTQNPGKSPNLAHTCHSSAKAIKPGSRPSAVSEKDSAGDDGSEHRKHIWCFSYATGATGQQVDSDYMQHREQEETGGYSLRCVVDVWVYVKENVLPMETSRWAEQWAFTENENYIKWYLNTRFIFSPCSVSLVLKWTGDALPLLLASTSNTSLCDVETSVISRQILLKLDFLQLLTDFTSQTKRTYFHRRNMKQREARGCVWGRRSLGSIVEPGSARAASLRAGDAPNQELLCGVPDPAQPPVVRPVGQCFQWAVGWTCYSAGTFYVSQHLQKCPKPISD